MFEILVFSRICHSIYFFDLSGAVEECQISARKSYLLMCLKAVSEIWPNEMVQEL